MAFLDLQDAESLRRAYVIEGRSLSAIAKMAGCSYASVRRALLAQGIEIRRSGPAPIGDLRNRAWLQARVSEGSSAKDIAELLGCAEGTVRSALQWAGVAAAPARARPSALDDAPFLQRAYIAEGRSVRSIAEEVGCTKDAVLVALRAHGVPIRSRGRSIRPAPDTATEVRDVPAPQEDVAVEARAASMPEGGRFGPEWEREFGSGADLRRADDRYAVRGEPFLEPEPQREADLEPASDLTPGPELAPEPQPEPEPEVEPEPELVAEAEPEPEPDPEPLGFELALPPVHPERSKSAGATLASFEEPSSEFVPEPPPSALGPAQHETGAPVMNVTTPSAATQSEPTPPPSVTGAPPPLLTLPARVDREIDEIEKKTFPVARRGYDRQEVDAFLRSIAADYRQVVKSARDAVNAARAAASRHVPPAPTPPVPEPKPTVHAFEDIGGRVTAVLTSAAEAADEIRASAEKEALAIRQRAREETERLRREAAEELAEAEQVRVANEQYAAEAESAARAEADMIIAAAQQRVAQLEEEAQERITTMDRTVRARIDAAIAEARRDYEHLRSAQQQCIDRLASVEFLAKHARDGLSENIGQPIDELL